MTRGTARATTPSSSVAGHNGLVCATYLARAGRSVLVLEAAGTWAAAAVDARVRARLPSLRRRAPAAPDAGSVAAGTEPRGPWPEVGRRGIADAPRWQPTGQHLALGAGPRQNCRPPTRGLTTEWQRLLRQFPAVLHPVLNAPPPRLGTDARGDRRRSWGSGWRMRRLGRRDMRELLRIGLMNVHDLLEDRFEIRC